MFRNMLRIFLIHIFLGPIKSNKKSMRSRFFSVKVCKENFSIQVFFKSHQSGTVCPKVPWKRVILVMFYSLGHLQQKVRESQEVSGMSCLYICWVNWNPPPPMIQRGKFTYLASYLKKLNKISFFMYHVAEGPSDIGKTIVSELLCVIVKVKKKKVSQFDTRTL